jgi:hypothetical protein
MFLLDLTLIVLYSRPNFRKVGKKQDFSVLLFKVSAWLSNHALCKIGLKNGAVSNQMTDVGRETGVY